jgi:N-formylglutamate amidohydrolase
MDAMETGRAEARAPLAAEARSAPAPAAFVLVEPLHRTAPTIFASPHSGRRYPPEMLSQTRVGLLSLRRQEDAYVDELFAGAGAHGASLVSASVARAYVDFNRDPEELDPDMFDADMFEQRPRRTQLSSARVLAGLGAIPRVCSDGAQIYGHKLPLAEAERRIALFHRPYHATLAALIEETRAKFGCAVLIDCHSMPSSARGVHAPDIVLGDRFGAACHPSVTALAEATLRRLGYRVARNAPFAGGHTTQIYGRPLNRVHALQIEISRALYLDEHTLERSKGFARVRADMARLAEAMGAAALHKSLA